MNDKRISTTSIDSAFAKERSPFTSYHDTAIRAVSSAEAQRSATLLTTW
jgi:hypothetical protein